MSAFISTLQDLHTFDGQPADFWQHWTTQGCRALGGEFAALYARLPGQPPGQGWAVVNSWPAMDGGSAQVPALAATVAVPLLEQALKDEVAEGPVLLGPWRAALILFRPASGEQELLLCVHLQNRQAAPSAGDLRLVGWVPRFYEQGRHVQERQSQADQYAQALELLGRVLESERFDQAALGLVNALAERFSCEQVSLLWGAREGLRLRAVSHSEKLGRRSAVSDLLEEAGQEAMVQGKEIAWPPQGKVVTRAHRQYADASQPGHLLTVPLTVGGEHLGALVCERQATAFSAGETWMLRLLSDQVSRPLRDLEKKQRNVFKRVGAELWQGLPRQLRPLTAEGRRFTLALAAALLLLLFAPLPYAVEASFVVKTDDMAFVGAPFDGFIESSTATLGAPVRAGEPVFVLSVRELLLERAAALADIAQNSREVEKRRAANQLAEMGIAEAQLEQAQAKLEQLQFRLKNASVASPIDGIVVEGEPRKNLGGAVKRGDTVVKIARVDRLYADIAVKERDVHLVRVQQDADIMLVSNPNQTYAMKVQRITPAASVKDGHNTFPVRAQSLSTHPAWWRPGMTGVAKIDVGYRPLAWVMTHRFIDYLRLTFWL
ncbi:efflux RND transporter periplasmic adaptor subunit [Lacisediminimonas sp.]|uniref:efflux RND transporter periplasmic adaptor subunit n=1 Tax=Lacisediminimonas sp. TaxID=3060582 RepID=UPI00271EB72C|nr:efflux RND transporter periplasmic adaptor subunit [Lacisediminimonas sp.]MDO8299946.1 efflux RND transporter periplasmic adaptor subunit [Lacisediminimonas sp.]